MNKLIFALLVLIAFQFGRRGTSQTINQVELYFAPTLATISEKDSYRAEHVQPGFRFETGMSYMRRIYPKASIGAGFSYSSMGYNYFYSYTQQGEETTVKDRIFNNYVEFPFRFSVQINNDPENSFFVDINVINQLLILYNRKSNIYPDDRENYKDLRDKDWEVYNVAIQFCATYQKRFTSNYFHGISPFFKINIKRNPLNWSVGLKMAVGRNF
jgi:hypothetical protein